MAKLSAAELQRFLESSFSQVTSTVEQAGDGRATIRQKITEWNLRPGGTVSGPTLMAMADSATYLALLSEIGLVPLVVTTNLNITFLRKPAADRDLLAKATLLKVGRRLAVAEVRLYSDGSDEMLAHATVTYSIPPER